MSRWLLIAVLIAGLGCTRHLRPGSEYADMPRMGDAEPSAEASSTDWERGEVVVREGTAAAIAVDGLFHDWEAVPVLLEDKAGDAGPTGIDFTLIKAANDADYLYLYMEIGVELELDWGHRLAVYLDCDGIKDSGLLTHGLGAEIRWLAGDRQGQAFGANGLHDIWFTDIGFRAAPAVSSATFEMAFNRQMLAAVAPACVGEEVYIALVDDTKGRPGSGPTDFAPEGYGKVEYRYDDAKVPAPPPVDLSVKDPECVRLLTYNVLWDGMLEPEKSEHFRRILQAIQPDIINLQEIIEHEDAADKVKEWLGGEWEHLGYSDRLTLSRHPIVWDWPPTYQPLSSRYTVVPVKMLSGQMLVIFNAHLSFGSNDADRQWEADSFIAYLEDMTTPGGWVDADAGTPFVLVGDLNLVGDSQQLTTLVTGDIVNGDRFGQPHSPDWDGTDLTDLFPHQTGSRMGFTWQYDDGSFWPGKLDYFIYSDSVLEVKNSFILNSAEMSDEELAACGLEREDTAKASDHLPVVVDFVTIPLHP